MHRTDDPVRDHYNYEHEVALWQSMLPVCDCCDNPIQVDCYYQAEPDLRLCEKCWDDYVSANVRKYIEI